MSNVLSVLNDMYGDFEISLEEITKLRDAVNESEAKALEQSQTQELKMMCYALNMVDYLLGRQLLNLKEQDDQVERQLIIDVVQNNLYLYQAVLQALQQ